MSLIGSVLLKDQVKDPLCPHFCSEKAAARLWSTSGAKKSSLTLKNVSAVWKTSCGYFQFSYGPLVPCDFGTFILPVGNELLPTVQLVCFHLIEGPLFMGRHPGEAVALTLVLGETVLKAARLYIHGYMWYIYIWYIYMDIQLYPTVVFYVFRWSFVI